MNVKSKIPVRDIMTTKLITISSDATLAEASKVMSKNDIGGILVEKKGDLVGIFTEKDLVNSVSKGKNPTSIKLKDAMSSPLITIEPDQSILDAAQLMTKNKIRKLPVKNKGKLVGIITADDIVRIAPREIELLLELASIKTGAAFGEGEFKGATRLTEGDCDTCGNYSDNLRRTDSEEYVCNDCYSKEEAEEEE
ncbi:TPA: CBS domain-containing protein [archaeon]|nr:CBS domain-containing protein [Candidatus Naiadarchaeales archaeon SRR2090153.bin461]